MPAAYIILDEAAKLVKNKSSEAHPYKLLMERNKSFALHKVIEASTPASEQDPFWQSLANSSWCKYMVPCPWCGEMMEFKFDKEHLRWEGETQEEIEKTARIICTKCCCELDDNMRREAMKHGKWVKQNENHERDHTGYHINSLYSCWTTIGQVAWEFVKSNKSIMRSEALHNFHNSWLALPWTEHKMHITEEDTRKLISKQHRRGELPEDMLYLCLGVDVGQSESHWVVTAVCQGGRLVVVDWGTMLSISSEKDKEGVSWMMENKTYRWQGREYKIDIAYVDSGYSTNAVYDECRRAPLKGLINPVKGSGASGTYARSTVKTNDLDLIIFNDFSMKLELYGRMYEQGEVVLPWDADNDLIAGLSGQRLIVDSSGRKKWQNVENDHLGDALKYALLSMLIACENDKMRESIRPTLNW